MKIQKIFFSVLFLLIAVFAFSKGAYAAGLCDFSETTPADCCTSLYAGGDCLDVGKDWYVGSSCVMNSTVTTALSAATAANKQYNCVTGATQCRTGYIDCSGTCKVALTDDGVDDGVDSDGILPPDDLPAPCSSVVLNRSGYNQCTGLCNNECKTGYEKDPAFSWSHKNACRASCAAGTLKGASGCISMDNIVTLLAPVFGTTVATFLTDLTTATTGIAARIADPTYGIDYYLLTATARNPVTKISDYNYNSVKPDVWLSADYADMSWALDFTNPANAILQEIINEWTGLNLCTLNSDCTGTGEVCVGGFCQVLGAVGDVCTDNFDCATGLYCNAGVCAVIDGGTIAPSGITPGLEDQVLTTIDNSGTLVASWEDPTVGAGAANYLGVSNNAFSASIGYVGANAECASSYATKTDVHVCMSSEILDNINRGVDSALGLAAGNAVWINNGPPAFTANANDCRGWTQPNASYYGTTWVIMGADGVGGLSKCNIATYKFACCGTN